MKYKRVLLKLSGEALMGNQQYGIDPVRLNQYADEIKKLPNQAPKLPSSLAAATFSGDYKEPVKGWIGCRATIWG